LTFRDAAAMGSPTVTTDTRPQAGRIIHKPWKRTLATITSPNRGSEAELATKKRLEKWEESSKKHCLSILPACHSAESECVSETSTKTSLDPFNKSSAISRYSADLEDSWIMSFINGVQDAAPPPKAVVAQLESFMDSCPIHDETDRTIKGSWNQYEQACSVDVDIYRKGEALDFCADILVSTTQILRCTVFQIRQQLYPSNPKAPALDELDKMSSPPSMIDASAVDEVGVAEANVLHMLLEKLRLARQEPETDVVPEEGGDGNSDSPSGGTTGIAKVDSRNSSSQLSSGVSSQVGQKRHRLPGGSPDSDDDKDEDENPKRRNERKPRRRAPRLPEDLGCPFYKHDPEKYGGRGGCSEYSHHNMSILLRVSNHRATDLLACLYRLTQTGPHRWKTQEPERHRRESMA
jgi:hypothetical protein